MTAVDPGRRMASVISRAVAAALRSVFVAGTVTTVTNGAGVGGVAGVVVAFAGDTYRVPYLASYTPAVGDVVLMARAASLLVILGRIVGGPPS